MLKSLVQFKYPAFPALTYLAAIAHSLNSFSLCTPIMLITNNGQDTPTALTESGHENSGKILPGRKPQVMASGSLESNLGFLTFSHVALENSFHSLSLSFLTLKVETKQLPHKDVRTEGHLWRACSIEQALSEQCMCLSLKKRCEQISYSLVALLQTDIGGSSQWRTGAWNLLSLWFQVINTYRELSS